MTPMYMIRAGMEIDSSILSVASAIIDKSFDIEEIDFTQAELFIESFVQLMKNDSEYDTILLPAITQLSMYVIHREIEIHEGQQLMVEAMNNLINQYRSK